MNLSRCVRFYYDLLSCLFRFYFFDENKLYCFQDSQFKAVIKSACADIPFYRDKFLEGDVNLNKVYNLHQINSFPFVTPEALYAQPRHARSNMNCSHMMLRSTGTITGKIKDVYLSCFDWYHSRRLAYLRMFLASGCSPLDKTLFLRPSQASFDIRPKWFWNIGLMREEMVSGLKYNLEQIVSFNLSKADVLNCLTDDGLALANFIRLRDKHIRKVRHLFITGTTGEMLASEERQAIASTLAEKTTDFYASTEAGIIAWQCTRTGVYHINADQIYVEITDGDRVCKDGENGEITLTTLLPCCSPLIRYKTGDRAVLKRGKCECGSCFPSLSRITGRRE